jgi:hypothetical protein
MIIPLPVLLRAKNISDKYVEKMKIHILFNKSFFSENRAVYEIPWKNTVQPDRPQITVQYGPCALDTR